MSKDNVKKMFVAMENNAEMKKKYTDMMLIHQKETEKKLADKIVELGKTSGFAFSNGDLLAARAEIMDKVNSNGELSDGDLSNVAGGNSLIKAAVVGTSIFTVGIGCAVLSAVSAITDNCSQTMAGKTIQER